MALFFSILINFLIKKHIIRNTIIFLIAILLAAQSFISIDPVSKNIYPSLSTGKAYPLLTAFQGSFLSDYSAYNHSYTLIPQMIDTALSQISPTEQDTILLLDVQSW